MPLFSSMWFTKYIERLGTGTRHDSPLRRRQPARARVPAHRPASCRLSVAQLPPFLRKRKTGPKRHQFASSRHQVDILRKCLTDSAIGELWRLQGVRISPNSGTKSSIRGWTMDSLKRLSRKPTTRVHRYHTNPKGNGARTVPICPSPPPPLTKRHQNVLPDVSFHPTNASFFQIGQKSHLAESRIHDNWNYE